MKKVVIFAFVFLNFLFSPFLSPNYKNTIFAATTIDYVDNDFPDGMDKAKLEGDVNVVGHVGAVGDITMKNAIRLIAGPIKGVTTNSDNQAYLQQMYKESFAYGAQTLVTYVFTNPPASTYAFVRDTGETLGFLPKRAYAQGIGFSGLSQLLPMWKQFRNIAYLLLAIFMIVIGFMIMFRKKIDPKTVVTVQNALPNIIVTLLLITFSYAIVGVLIDLMYLIIMIAISILKPISNDAITDATAREFISGNFFVVLKYLFIGGVSSLDDVSALFGEYASIGSIAVPGVAGFLGYLFTGNLAGIVTSVAVPGLLLLIILLAFIIASVRLLFLLISAYIQIILSLIISPFQLLMGAFPGSHAFESWIKNLIANIAVFPITAIMLLIGTILTKADYGGTALWGPPLIMPAGSSGLAGGGMGGVIGLGILFAIPSVAGSLKELLKAKPIVNAGPSAVIGPVTGAAGQTMQALYQISMIKGLLPKGKGEGAPPRG